MDKPISVLYKHPLWFEPLFAEFDRRGVAYERLHAAELVFDPGDREVPYSVRSPGLPRPGRAQR